MTGQASGLFVNQLVLGNDTLGTSKSASMEPPRMPAQSSFALSRTWVKLFDVSIGGLPWNGAVAPVNCPPFGTTAPATAGLPPPLAAGQLSVPSIRPALPFLC